MRPASRGAEGLANLGPVTAENGPATLGTPAQQVEGQVGQLQLMLLRGAIAAPQQRAHPRQQLGEGEGLDQVVVGSEFEAAHPVLDLAACGQEEHRHLAACRPQATQDAPAVEPRQHHIEHDEVVFAG